MNEEEYEDIEARLFLATEQFDYRWDKAWVAWVLINNLDDEEAAYMVNHCPFDDDGNMLPAAEEWGKIYERIKSEVEKEFGCKIIVDDDGAVFAQHTLADGDTITVP